MSTVSIRLYDIFRKNLKLQESDAKELVEVVQEVIQHKLVDKHEHMEQRLHKDIQSLKDYIDNRFATKEDLATNRVEMIKWMFIFWIGQVAATFGFILLFLKK
jgi:hypothetical protein